MNNREIKFRAWDTVKNKYVDNYYISQHEESDVWLNHIFTNERFIFQQYTGCKDQSGKDIFEGDILLHNSKTGIVEFFGGMFVASWLDQTDDELGYLNVKDMKVVGNIFENCPF